MQLENKSIGGYFELELPEGKGHYYPEALKYQSARAAFYDLLLHVKPNKVWMPYYICGSMLEPLEKANIETGFYSINLDFSIKDAQFKDLWLSDRAKKYIVEQDIYVKPGDKVFKFSGSHHTLGTMILQYSSLEEMMDMLDHMERDIRVIVE